MTTFFQQTAQAVIAKHINRFPLLKLDQVIDWQPIEQYLNRQRTRYLRDHRGRPAYPLLSMFKAVLLGQWHSLSDPELEHSLIRLRRCGGRFADRYGCRERGHWFFCRRW